MTYPVQGKKSTWGFGTLARETEQLTPEEIERRKLRDWLDDKRLKDANYTAREGFRGYKA